jgi:all-trans-retinol 13,14-reductase
MLIFICFLLLLICYLIDSIFQNKYPKQYKKIVQNKALNYKRVSIDRDRYSKKKIPKNIDAIVIGSGIGGLSTAAFLAKVGKKVLVLEQHYIAGGCTHSFEEKGVEHETGIHYIGNIEKRKKIFDLISDSEIEWCKMGKENNGVYDEIYIKDKKYLFRAGKENFIQDLVKVFPEEEQNIRNYIDLVIKVSQKDLYFNLKIIQSEWLYYLLSFFISKDYYKYVNAIAYDVIKQFTQNEDLIAVLCGQFGDYGAPPTKASFFVHASIVNHYLEGGYFPKYGTSNIPKRIIPTIEKAGGRVLVGKTVKKILIQNNKAYGIEMCNGDKIYADNIISGIGIRNTYQKLIHVNNDIIDTTISIPYNALIEKIPPSTSFMYLFVNLLGTPEELNLRSSNLWVWPDKNYEKVLDDFENNPLVNPMPFFIGCSCAKDSSWNDRFPGKSNAIILTTAKKEWFDIWEDEKCMHRGQEYNDLKEKFAQRMLNEGLFKFYPQLKDKVEHYDVGTPLTNQFYLGAYEGEAYGLDSTPTRYSESSLLRPKTNIKNFYLTGQDICTLGFTGALMAGVLTAHSVLGYGTMLDLISNRNLISDVINLDKKIKSDTNIKIMSITKKIA